MTDYFDLGGKVALVTGGSRGIGLEIARAFARQGADVAIVSRKIEACEEVAAELRAKGRRSIAVAANVGQWDALADVVDAVYDAFGRLDILVNNAGMSPVAPSSIETSEELFDKVVGVNFKGPFRLSALAGDRMVKAGSGNIINIGSTGSIRASKAYPVYAGAKSAINIMTRCHALEYGPAVRVNAIMCGPFWTDVSKSWREEADRNSVAAVKRIGRPEEVATTALYLASDKSTFTTGSVIQLDGGLP